MTTKLEAGKYYSIIAFGVVKVLYIDEKVPQYLYEWTRTLSRFERGSPESKTRLRKTKSKDVEVHQNDRS